MRVLTTHGPAPMTADAVLEAVRVARGRSFTLDGPCSGGEVGAYFAHSADGQRFVFKWFEHGEAFAEMVTLCERVGRLRQKGYPAPRYYEPVDFDGGVVVFQDAMPGGWRDDVDHVLVDDVLCLNDLQAGAKEEAESWTESIARTLTEGANGYCLHEPLRRYSAETRTVLSWVESVGADSRHLGGGDVVHFDFHHRNLLRVGDHMSAVVDWEGSTSGDRVFDLVTFCFGFTYAHAVEGVEERVWERAAALRPMDTLEAYVAHMALRRLDWTIRHHAASDVVKLLELIGRYQRHLVS